LITGIIIAAVVICVLLLAAIKPARYAIQRTITIQAPREKVFEDCCRETVTPKANLDKPEIHPKCGAELLIDKVLGAKGQAGSPTRAAFARAWGGRPKG
jgi:hypothetical protein